MASDVLRNADGDEWLGGSICLPLNAEGEWCSACLVGLFREFRISDLGRFSRLRRMWVERRREAEAAA